MMTPLKRLVIIGAGGQARDTAWLVSEINRRTPTYDLLGFVVSDLARLGRHDSPVLGDESWLASAEFDAIALGLGNPIARRAVASRLSAAFPTAEWPNLIHPNVTLDFDSLKLGRGVMIGANVVGSVNIALQDYVLINLGVTLGHEARLGPGTVVNHGASISGGVEISAGVLVGTGARVLQYLSVEENATVGAGAVVTRSVPSGQTVVGVPARPLR